MIAAGLFTLAALAALQIARDYAHRGRDMNCLIAMAVAFGLACVAVGCAVTGAQ